MEPTISFSPVRAEGVTVEDAQAAIAARGLTLEEDAPQRLVQAHADAVKLAALDARHLRGLDRSAGSTPVVRVAELETDVHDLRLLALLGETLMSGGV